MRTRALVPLLAALAATGPAWPDDGLQNWFNDPFFQISAFVADCPLPAGPFVDEADRRVQAHRRAEKGTTCWLAHECERPNAYAYDQDISARFKAAVQEHNPFPDTTLWVTVQGRVLYIEGCATRESQIAQVEAFARALPHVQQAIAILRIGAAMRAPYKLRRASPP